MRKFLFSTLAVAALSAALVAVISLHGSESEASHLTPTPSFHVDIGSSNAPTSTGNTYVEDDNADLDPTDQLMSVFQPLTACVERTVTDFDDPSQFIVITDIIIENADEMVGADVRFNYDPTKISLLVASMTPFTGSILGDAVGLMNLPAPPYATLSTHATAAPATNIDNTNGAAFLSGTYLGTRTFGQSTESGPTVDGATNTLPNRNAGHAPDGGVVFRLTWRLLAPSSGTDVLLDLTAAGSSFTGGGVVTGGSAFVTLTSETPTQEIVTLSDISDLFDGLIRVFLLSTLSIALPGPCRCIVPKQI